MRPPSLAVQHELTIFDRDEMLVGFRPPDVHRVADRPEWLFGSFFQVYEGHMEPPLTLLRPFLHQFRRSDPLSSSRFKLNRPVFPAQFICYDLQSAILEAFLAQVNNRRAEFGRLAFQVCVPV